MLVSHEIAGHVTQAGMPTEKEDPGQPGGDMTLTVKVSVPPV
jgi:hypothetical protein